MGLNYIIAGEIALISYLIIAKYRYYFLPERMLASTIKNYLIGVFIFGQLFFLGSVVTLLFWPPPTLGSFELLVRGVVINLLVLYHVKKAGEAYIELNIFGVAGDPTRRAIYNLYIFSAFIFAIFPLLIFVFLTLPAIYFYLAIIFLKLIFFPELFSVLLGFRRIDISKIIAVVYILLVFSTIFTMLTFANFFQAQHFNNEIVTTSEPPFKNEVPSHLVRLVDDNLARSIMLRYISEFGSNARLGVPHISLNGSDLIWIAPVYPNNLWAENYIKGFIIVHANDPLRPPTIIKEKFYIGNDLLGGHDAQIVNYLEDTNLQNSLAYFVVHPTDGIKLVLARVKVTPLIYSVPDKIVVYNNDGSIYAVYDWHNAPDWIPQLIDEDLIETIVTNWGDFRRGNSVDLFAPGFLWIPTSPDRVEITEDTRYIINPDSGRVEAFIHLHPIGNDRTLAGIIKINTSGIYFHDFKEKGLISGRVAHDIAESNLPRPATGYYFATMGMLYPVYHPKTHEIVWTWYVPVYWEKEGTTVFAGLALINARDISYFAFSIIREDEHGPDFVERVLNLYKESLMGKVVNGSMMELNTTIINKYTYVYEGTTHIVLHLNNTTVQFAEATPETVNITDWYQLLEARPGDYVNLTVIFKNNRWIITSFRILVKA